MYAPIRSAAFAALLLVGVAACGSDSSSSGSPGSGGASPTATTAAGRSGDYGTPAATAGGSTSSAAAVTIKSLAFNVPDSVKAGTEFTITNDDGFKHTFSDKGGKFDVSLDGGATQKLTIADPGTYEIVCHIHPSMHATLVVT